MAKLTTRQIALTSIFAGFYYLFSFLPGVPAPGIADLKIQIEACMATVFGYILGPFLGATATFLGVFVAWILPPGRMSPAGLFFMPSTVINAAVSGFLIQKRWKAAATSLGVLILIFWFTPPIQPVTEFWPVGIAVVWDKIIAFLLIGVVIFLDRKIRRSAVDEDLQTQGIVKPWLAPLLSVVASCLILCNNLLIAITGGAVKFQYGELKITFGYKAIINALGVFNYLWVVVALVSLFVSTMLWIRPTRRRTWAVAGTLCSLVSVVTGGGFIVGVLMAVVAGFFAFFEDRVATQVFTRLDVLQLFIMAFIGNEADNMWGSLIFAVPFIYETLYSLNIEIVRWLFVVSPFAYPAIRFLQAIVATAVAVPLLRTLRAAKLIPSMMDLDVR